MFIFASLLFWHVYISFNQKTIERRHSKIRVCTPRTKNQPKHTRIECWFHQRLRFHRIRFLHMHLCRLHLPILTSGWWRWWCTENLSLVDTTCNSFAGMCRWWGAWRPNTFLHDMSFSRSLSLSMYIHIYIYIYRSTYNQTNTKEWVSNYLHW